MYDVSLRTLDTFLILYYTYRTYRGLRRRLFRRHDGYIAGCGQVLTVIYVQVDPCLSPFVYVQIDPFLFCHRLLLCASLVAAGRIGEPIMQGRGYARLPRDGPDI